MPNEKELEELEEIAVPDADDPPVAAEDPIEKKYAAQMREISPQKVELPMSALQEMIEPKTGQIFLKPDFQRRDVWDTERRSRFIESIIMNIPLPPVFLGEVEYGKWAVLDGRQRLTSIYEFRRGSFRLTGLKIWKELNGKNFEDLQNADLDKFLLRQFIPAVIVKKESAPRVQYEVFDRLNTGGVVALPMEIRNAVYQGAFNKLLHGLSEAPDFLFLWGMPADKNKRTKFPFFNRMYDLEQVLRFFAVPEYDGTSKLKDFLGSFMDRRNEAYSRGEIKPEADSARFLAAYGLARALFGETAFRRPVAEGKLSTQRSAPLADALLYALSLVPPQVPQELASALKKNLDALSLTDPEFQRATTKGTNGKGAIECRLTKVRNVVQQTLGG
jgi:hypothetical protein